MPKKTLKENQEILYLKNKNISILNISTISKNGTIRSVCECMCKICNYIWKPLLYNILNHHKCPECSKCAKWTIEKLKSVGSFIHNNNVGYDLITNIGNSKEKLPMICNKNKTHPVFYITKQHHINSKVGCPECSECAKWTIEKLITAGTKLYNGDVGYSLITFIKNSRTLLPMLCNKNKTHPVFYKSIDHHINGKSGCPACIESMGEKKVRLCLENLNMKYIIQSKSIFKNCTNPKTRRKLTFDFYLIDYNTCIEFDGIYHYHPLFLKENGFKIPGNHNVKKYEDTVYRDIIKNLYCLNNNINLIRIHFWEINNIESIVKGLIYA